MKVVVLKLFNTFTMSNAGFFLFNYTPYAPFCKQVFKDDFSLIILYKQ